MSKKVLNHIQEALSQAWQEVLERVELVESDAEIELSRIPLEASDSTILYLCDEVKDSYPKGHTVIDLNLPEAPLGKLLLQEVFIPAKSSSLKHRFNDILDVSKEFPISDFNSIGYQSDLIAEEALRCGFDVINIRHVLANAIYFAVIALL